MNIKNLTSSSFFLDEQQLKERINPYLFQSNILCANEINEITRICSKELLNINRFDLLAKLDYLKNIEYADKSDWSERVYLEHIKAFNSFNEQDGSDKNSAKKFINNFNELYESIKRQGFNKDISIIPIDNNGIIIDGAHRLACSIILGLDVYCWVTNISAKNYSYQYFLNRGFSQEYVDYLILQYCLQKDNTYSAIIFPAAIDHNENTKSILEKYSKILYHKTVYLPYLGLFNLIRQAYHGEKWLGTWETCYSGAHSKAKNCYGKSRKVTLYILECDNQINLNIAKREIRDINHIENHSVHINDTHAETIVIASTLLNKNSINFLKQSKPRNFTKFYPLFYQYRQWINKEKVHPNTLCVDGSSVMSVFGIRDAQDLDFISLQNDLSSDQPLISNHNHELKYHSLSKEKLVLDPENYFYYQGLKFISLEHISRMKKTRNEYPKDIIDQQLINKHINRNFLSVAAGELLVSRAKILVRFRKLKRIIKNILLNSQNKKS